VESPGVVLRPTRKSDWIRNAAYVAVACLAIVGLALWLGRTIPFAFPAGAVLILALLVYWHSRTTGYRCPICSAEFAISAWADFLSPHMLTTKYVKCPACGQREWMEARMRSGS